MLVRLQHFSIIEDRPKDLFAIGEQAANAPEIAVVTVPDHA